MDFRRLLAKKLDMQMQLCFNSHIPTNEKGNDRDLGYIHIMWPCTVLSKAA